MAEIIGSIILNLFDYVRTSVGISEFNEKILWYMYIHYYIE